MDILRIAAKSTLFFMVFYLATSYLNWEWFNPASESKSDRSTFLIMIGLSMMLGWITNTSQPKEK